MSFLINNALIINEGCSFIGSVLVESGMIAAVYKGGVSPADCPRDIRIVDASGKWLLPGAIDDQVHFREPGLTHKGDIWSESRAAVAGGITSYMDMPNTKPQTTTLAELEWKFQRASETSAANYSFFLGGTNENAHLLKQLDPQRIPGIKLFLGSSTGNMLVDDQDSMRRFFSETGLLIAVHAEKEDILRANRAYYVARYGENLDMTYHPLIRSDEACFASSSEAVALATKLGTRLHIFHLSTARELALLDRGALNGRKITGEVCIPHLWFCDGDYPALGTRIKWNPAVKTAADRDALRRAVNDDTLVNVATDHAPHLLSEKEGSCLIAASGGPMVQHALLAMLEMAADGVFTKEKVVEKMAHHPATLFHIDRRGYIREGYYADLVLVDPEKTTSVAQDNLLYKCRWSPFEGFTFRHSIYKTFVNGKEIFSEGQIVDESKGMALKYN